MPLINCPVCSNQISDKAEYCPKCGHPIREGLQPPKSKFPASFNLGWMAVAVILAILLLFLLLSTCEWKPVV